jgi:hypothetical protein
LSFYGAYSQTELISFTVQGRKKGRKEINKTSFEKEKPKRKMMNKEKTD